MTCAPARRATNGCDNMSPNPKAINATPSIARRMLTVAVAADRVDMSERSVRRWIAEGALRVHRLGRAVRIDEHDLEDFLARTRR